MNELINVAIFRRLIKFAFRSQATIGNYRSMRVRGKVHSNRPTIISSIREQPPGAPEALALLFADDVEMITRWAQKNYPQGALITEWDWSFEMGLPINPVLYNYLTFV